MLSYQLVVVFVALLPWAKHLLPWTARKINNFPYKIHLIGSSQLALYVRDLLSMIIVGYNSLLGGMSLAISSSALYYYLCGFFVLCLSSQWDAFVSDKNFFFHHVWPSLWVVLCSVFQCFCLFLLLTNCSHHTPKFFYSSESICSTQKHWMSGTPSLISATLLLPHHWALPVRETRWQSWG